MANANDKTTAANDNATPRRIVRRRRLPDQNRPFEILSILILYIVVVHFALKFASFLLPDSDEVPTREEMLALRGARSGVALGFSVRSLPAAASRRSRPSHSVVKSGSAIHNINILHRNIHEQSSIRFTSEDTKEEGVEPKTTPKHNRPRIPILSYQSKYVIVSKPSGITMHHNSASRWGRAKTTPWKWGVLQTAIQKQLGRKPYLIHRLDHRTSGACIIGFDSKSAGILHGRMRGEDSKKLYVALVRGDLREKFQCAAEAGVVGDGTTTVDMSMDGDGGIIGSCGSMPEVDGGEEYDNVDVNNIRREAGSEYNGKISVNLPIKVDGIEKEAQTDFYFLSSIDLYDENEVMEGGYMTKSLTLLLCQPKTGRTHQIRRHVQKAFNAPIIGDSEHGDSRVNRFWRQTAALDRLALHCWYIELPPVVSSSMDDAGEEGAAEHNGVESSVGKEGIKCLAPLATDFTNPLQHEMLRPLWEEAMRIEPRLKMEPYDERGGSFGRYYQKRRTQNESTEP